MKGNLGSLNVLGASRLQKILLAVASSVGALANPKRGGIKYGGATKGTLKAPRGE